MTPTVVELLNSCIITLVTPQQPEDAASFAAASVRLAAMVNKLAILECADAASVRIWENAVLRSLISEVGPRYGVQPDESEHTADGDFSLGRLDAANARLRLLLVDLHEAVELAQDAGLDRRILSLYREVARRRELQLPPTRPTR